MDVDQQVARPVEALIAEHRFGIVLEMPAVHSQRIVGVGQPLISIQGGQREVDIMPVPRRCAASTLSLETESLGIRHKPAIFIECPEATRIAVTKIDTGLTHKIQPLTLGPSTYKVPAIGDLPVDFRVALLGRATQAGVIGGSKAVGEPPFMLAISAVTALRHAIGAFGSKRPVDLALPATPEAVLRAIEARR